MAREWLKEARARANMSQADVARELGISESYYAYIEQGERQKQLDITLCAKLSKIFSIEIQQIVEFEAK